MPTEAQSTFIYSLGEHVHWALGGEPWAHAWQVIQQRLTVTLITQVVDYLLISVADPGHAPVWAAEADLLPWHTRQL